MKKNLKSFGVDSLKYMPAKFIEGIMGILIIVFYTRLFPPDEYGLFSLIVGFIGILTTVTIGWLNNALLRYYDENKNNKSFFTTVFFVWFGVNLLVLIVYILVILFLDASALYPMDYFLYPFFVLGNTWILLSTLLRAARMSSIYSILLSTLQVLKFVLVIVLVKLFDIGVLSIILSTIICEFIVVYIAAAKFKITKKISFSTKDISKKLLRKFLNYGIPLIGVAVVTWVLSVSDRYVIAYFRGTGESGIYTIGYSLVSQPLNLIISSLMLSAFPIIIKTWNESGKKETESFISRITNYYLIIMVPAITGIFLLKEDIFNVLADKSYFSGNVVLPWIALGFLFLGLTQYVNKILELRQKTFSLLVIIAIVSAINFILNLIFVPFYGMVGASVTTMVSYVIYFIISLSMTRKLFSFKIRIKSLFKILISSIIMGLVIIFLRAYITNIFILGVLIVIAFLVYIVSLYLLGEIKEEVKTLTRKFKK